jgi:broad specificity phosphatase PhoE
MIIKLVRHGESMGNTGQVDVINFGDHNVGLTQLGQEQAREAGQRIGAEFLHDALAYCSPFRRARETMAALLAGAGVAKEKVRIFEDPRLREVDHGYVDVEAQQGLRRTHGWFYYRYNGGESPADCYDRTCTFLESLMRQAQRKNAERVLVVTHSLTIRCFVMRFLHLKVEDFDRMAGLPNCAVVTLARLEQLQSPVFRSGRWGVGDLPLRLTFQSAKSPIITRPPDTDEFTG